MCFTMKGGVLTEKESQQVQAVLKGAFVGPQKRIYAKDGTLALRTDIRKASSEVQPGDARGREYVLLTPGGAEYVTARPGYSKEDDPSEVGWPVSRVPHVNHAHVFFNGNEYYLTADRERNYALLDQFHKAVAEFRRKGLISGWDVEAEDRVPAEVLCAIFAFCQYLRQENEFYII